MIAQHIDVDGFWECVVFYDIDHALFDFIAEELYFLGASRGTIESIKRTLEEGKAKAFTYSNIDRKKSIVGFNRHDRASDYLNSIVHEAEHVKQAMLKTYRVEDSNEPPAYTVGYLVQKMYSVFKEIAG